MNLRKLYTRAMDMAAIRSLMTRYQVAVDRGDLETALSCHADDEEISAVSLDSTYLGRDEVRQFLQKLFSPAVREGKAGAPRQVHLCLHQDTAVLVVEHQLSLLRPQREKLDCRITFTLVRTGPDWRILHSHLSAPRKAFVDVGDAAH